MMGGGRKLRSPYLLFLADAPSDPFAKTAFGVRDWAPDRVLGQCSLPDCGVDLGLPAMEPEAAAAAGCGSFVIGVATAGGGIPPSWYPLLLRSIEAGMDIVSGMHVPLAQVPGLAEAASKQGTALIDVRLSADGFETGTGRPRTGKRLLTVGTDCAQGKKYTALMLAKALRARGVDADFRATGQTGIMISGGGVALDAVVSDFLAGAAEAISPDAAPNHWDVIEGQGSLFHPAYAGVTVGLVHGSQPDVLILCHDPSRDRINSLPDFPLPSLAEAARRYLELAKLTNPAVCLAGVSLNLSRYDAAERDRILARTEAEMGVPCFDPMQSALDAVTDRILASRKRGRFRGWRSARGRRQDPMPRAQPS